MALTSEPLASTTAPIRPNTISEKYSAGPNWMASLESGTANAARPTVPMVPAMNEPMPAAASAGPGRPFLAMACPSSAVTMLEGSPGRFTRMAVVEPPYCAP